MSELPIYALEEAFLAGLAQGRVVVQAPTGSGKSTQIPQILWRHGLLEQGQAVILQPRRLATRMLAKRVAEELGAELGGLVGYQIRLEAKVSAATKIRFVTEGVVLRQMTGDPHLRGVAVLVFDEFHERHLYGDISLARALQIQRTTRPDLKIVVMSATLDTAILRDYLAPCEVLTSEGRTFPVTMRYWPTRVDPARDAVWEVAAQACTELVGQTPGDLLVFMPGAYEINRTIQACGHQPALRGCTIMPLHGELPPAAQDAAVARQAGGARKIIVSTNVAETSLTIDGVTGVIDAGLARMARFDAQRGINTLLVEKISRAAADQRAGRAGRTAPGVCLRLWTEKEHAQRPPQELPEVKRLDLCEVVLTLKASGINDIARFPWIEAPDALAQARAEQLLDDLGAITGRGITEVGRKMLRFPVHPRYARMLLEADTRGCVRPVALMAAITQGRSFLLRGADRAVEHARSELLGDEADSDFFLLMRAWRYAHSEGYRIEECRRLGIHAQGARQVGPLFEQFLELARKEGLDLTDREVPAAEVARCVLAGFADQLARRLDRGTLRCALVHNRKGMLARESALHDAELFVAAEITEVGGRDGEANVLLSLVTRIEEAWLAEVFPEAYHDGVEVVYDTQQRRVICRSQRRFRDLVLAEKQSPQEPSDDAAARLLAVEVLAGRLSLGEWNEKVDQWIVRVNRLAEWFPELELSPIRPEDRELLVEQICYGARGARDLKDKPVMPVLEQWLTAEQLAVLDDYLPERLVMANGRRARVNYGEEGPPVLSARIQELYGIERTFSLGHGRVPVKFEVLAPNQRPIQVTDDLASFWRDMYPKLKIELSRRYPRHEWR